MCHLERIGDMKRCALIWLSFMLMTLVPSMAMADVSISLKLNTNDATLADTLQLTVTVSGIRSTHSEPVVKGLGDFYVNEGGTSSRLEIINDHVSSSMDYTYFIQPKKTGTFQVGPAEIKVKGKTLQSNSETVMIRKSEYSGTEKHGPVFLTAKLSADSTYVEQQVLYILKLYRRTKVADLSLQLPKIDHLTFKQLGKPRHYESTYNGYRYRVLEVTYSILPSETGTYTLSPARMGITVFEPQHRSRRNPFDDFFNDPFDDPFFSFSTGRPMTLTSNALQIKVLPLPRGGRPANFSGLVGTFKIESKLQPLEIKEGNSATLTVILKGRGNVNRIPDLKIPEMEDIKIYPDQPVLKVESDTNGLYGSKAMKWALVPTKEGEYTIPAMSLSYFDSESHQYKTIKTAAYHLHVLPSKKAMGGVSGAGNENLGSGSPMVNASAVTKEKVKTIGHDIFPLHDSMKAFNNGRQFNPGKALVLLLLLSPAGIYVIVFVGLKAREHSSQNVMAMNMKKARKNFLKRVQSSNTTADEFLLAVRDYLNDRFGLTLGSVTSDETACILASHNVTEQTIKRFHALLQRVENEIYTGRGAKVFHTDENIPELMRRVERESR